MTGKKVTAELVAEVERLLREGGTASSIGAAVGKSRNAVVGLVHRHLRHIGFKMPAPKMVAIVKKRRAIDARRALLRERAMMGPDREAIPAQPPQPPQPPEPPTQPLLWELREHHCRWPLWSDDVVDVEHKRFCGAPKANGSYCAHHAGKVYSVAVRRR